MSQHLFDQTGTIAILPQQSHRDEVTHRKIHRHLTDINDRITEEDIRNIEINIKPRAVEQDLPRIGFRSRSNR